MGKTIFKEITIILLLLISILLILGIIFYDYVPILKILPEKPVYTTSQEVSEVISSENVKEETVVMTYSVDSTDLNNYQRVQDYVPGKANPFSGFEDDEENTTTENENGNSTTNNNSGTTSNNKDNDKDDNNGDAPGKFYDENVK